jgi:hypothetical protein
MLGRSMPAAAIMGSRVKKQRYVAAKADSADLWLFSRARRGTRDSGTGPERLLRVR